MKKMRLVFDSRLPDATVCIKAFFTQFDTRHDVNNPDFVLGCDLVFRWTRDLQFLRDNLNRMRTALRYILEDFHLADRKVVLLDFVGHDGRAGFTPKEDGTKEMHWGHGIGSNYWDLLPIGHLDPYVTMLAYSALLRMADLEEQVRDNPGWNIPVGALALEPDELRRLGAEVRSEFQSLFWNNASGRFVAAIDADGKAHDYGLTFLNLEAIHYGLASEEQARSILEWIDGARIVVGDTSTGKDIYRWRFAPRATTKRNVDWYGWFWHGPETIDWGYQVQDGGAVLGFSFHDIMARLEILGADDAWNRLIEIANWFAEVQTAGGYRAYYSDPQKGSLQGGGTPGGLGLDKEFLESILVPQTILYGFLGFEPHARGFDINPKLPEGLPSLKVKGVLWSDLNLDIEVAKDAVVLTYRGFSAEPIGIGLPPGEWNLEHSDSHGAIRKSTVGAVTRGVCHVDLSESGRLHFTKSVVVE